MSCVAITIAQLGCGSELKRWLFIFGYHDHGGATREDGWDCLKHHGATREGGGGTVSNITGPLDWMGGTVTNTGGEASVETFSIDAGMLLRSSLKRGR